ncbi:MAG: hypothetical protein AAGF23_08095, partial [Acidobacteriota bacterium]
MSARALVRLARAAPLVLWAAAVAADPDGAALPCGVGVADEAVATGVFEAGDRVIGWRASVGEATRRGDQRHPRDWNLLRLAADGRAGWRWRGLRGGSVLDVDGPAPVAMGRPPADVGCPGWTSALAEQIDVDRRALALRGRREYAAAFELRRRAFERLPADAPAVLRPLLERELAWDAEEAGDAETARTSYARAREGWAALRPDSLALADAEHLVGTQLFWLGELEAAEAHLRRGLELRRRLAPGSPSVGRSANNLGLVRRERG